MKSDYDEMIREAFSEKIQVPKEYQQKIKETLKQTCITSPQREKYSVDIFFRTGSKTENFFQRHKISAKTCLAVAGGICACLGLIIVLSVFLTQGSPEKDFNNTQYIKISATPASTEKAVTADNSLRTETPADTESPQRTKLPSDTTKPTPNVANTYIPEKKNKNDTEVVQSQNDSESGNSTTANHQKDATATPKRNQATRSPELAQVQTSYTPETVEIPQKTTTPENIERPEKTKTPESTTPQSTSVPKVSVEPNYSETMLPATSEVPAATPT